MGVRIPLLLRLAHTANYLLPLIPPGIPLLPGFIPTMQHLPIFFFSASDILDIVLPIFMSPGFIPAAFMPPIQHFPIVFF